MTATPQPRHPLALLADGWEARARLLTENARAEQSEQSARYYAARAAEAQDCATQLREALRAQAEAEAVPDVEAARAHRWLTLRNDLTSVFEKLGCFDESGEWRDTDEADQWRALAHKVYESADRLGRMNRRAALAQRHIKMGDGRMAWCGAPLKPTDKAFADLDEAEGRLTNPAARVIPCEKCWHNIHVMAANKHALAQAGGES